jgi:membrane protein
MKWLKEIWIILKETFSRFFSQDPMNFSAAIAFYTIFSLPAVLLIVLVVAGSVFGEEAVSGELYYRIKELMGQDSAEQVQRIIQNAAVAESDTIATIVGVVILCFSATTVFISMQNGLNCIWGVKAKPTRGWIKFIVNRVLSLGMVLSLGFLLLVSLLLEATIEIFSDYLISILPDATFYLIRLINFILAILLTSLVFALIFKFLPDAVISWRDVWVGALITTILFMLGRVLIRVYLSNSDYSETYDAAGSLVAILLWVYYSSVIVLLGAQFAQVYSQRYGQTIKPCKDAVLMVEKRVNPKEQSYEESG